MSPHHPKEREREQEEKEEREGEGEGGGGQGRMGGRRESRRMEEDKDGRWRLEGRKDVKDL